MDMFGNRLQVKYLSNFLILKFKGFVINLVSVSWGEKLF